MTTKLLAPVDAARMLHDRGVHLASVATPSAMTEALCRACGDHRLSVKSLPEDLHAIRDALAGLWPPSQPTPAQARAAGPGGVSTADRRAFRLSPAAEAKS